MEKMLPENENMMGEIKSNQIKGFQRWSWGKVECKAILPKCA